MADAVEAMPSALKLALIGCGRISQQHFNGIRVVCSDLVTVTAVVDTSLARATEMQSRVAAAGGSAVVYTDVATALAEGDFEAVDIMLPHQLHLPVTRQCFDAGKHVLLEKPVAHNLEDAEKILAAATVAQSNGLVFMMAENSQYWPEVVAAKELISSGAIGRLLSARAVFNGTFNEGDDSTVTHADVTSSYAVMDGDSSVGADRPWRFDKAATGGGIVIDGGAHWIRPLRMLMGEVDAVTGVTATPFDRMEGESLGRALLRFENGTVGYLECSFGPQVYGPDQSWRVMGTAGEIIIDGKGVCLYNKDWPQGRDVFEKPEAYSRFEELGVDVSFEGLAMPLAGYHASFGHEIGDFAAVVKQGKVPAVPTDASLADRSQAEHSLGEMRTALALYRAAQSGQWEKVWDD
jgi:UDP-N-acetyl-2-amino-2-deoxyglucuronate dehydrogenase